MHIKPREIDPLRQNPTPAWVPNAQFIKHLSNIYEETYSYPGGYGIMWEGTGLGRHQQLYSDT